MRVNRESKQPEGFKEAGGRNLQDPWAGESMYHEKEKGEVWLKGLDM